MPIFDIYSKRQRKIESDVPEIYTYDDIPCKVRQQIWYIFRDSKSYCGECIGVINQVLCREYGIEFLITPCQVRSIYEAVNIFFISNADTLQCLDIIEMIGHFIETEDNEKKTELLKELNERFKENSIGYQFENGRIIKVDSTYMHTEVVKPTLALLQNQAFKGACDEYMKAHEHYKNGNNKECLNECLKAFESTMKVICTEKIWSCDKKATAKALIATCLKNGLLPPYMQNQYSFFQGLLESGIPTIRNTDGGHGQGATIKNVDDSLTRFTLNLTGSNIIFLIEQSGIK